MRLLVASFLAAALGGCAHSGDNVRLGDYAACAWDANVKVDEFSANANVKCFARFPSDGEGVVIVGQLAGAVCKIQNDETEDQFTRRCKEKFPTNREVYPVERFPLP